MRDLFKEALSKNDLRELLAGRPASTIFAARSPTVKKLSLEVAALTDEQLLDLMAQHPTLIRRPLLIEDDQLVVGFDRPAYARRFG